MKHFLSIAKTILFHLLPITWAKKIPAKKRKYFQVLLGAILVVLVPLGLSTFRNPDTARAAWPAPRSLSEVGYNDNWDYRKAIIVRVTKNLRIFIAAGGFFGNKPNQNQGNNTQKSRNLCQCNLVSQINHISSKTPSVKTASLQKTITAITFIVKIITLALTNIAKNQAATKLEQTAENTFNWAGVMVYIINNVSTTHYPVNYTIASIESSTFRSLSFALMQSPLHTCEH